MNPYWLLVPVFVLCCVGSGLTYTDSARKAWWFVYAVVPLWTACGVLFCWAAKTLEDKQSVYVFGLAYDVLMVLAYYILPLVVFGTKVSPGVMVGAGLIVLGLLVVKVCG